MIWKMIGLSPISTIGLDRRTVSSVSRVPNPPARMMAFTGRYLLPVSRDGLSKPSPHPAGLREHSPVVAPGCLHHEGVQQPGSGEERVLETILERPVFTDQVYRVHRCQ